MPVLGKPLRERPGTQGKAKTFLDVGGNALARLTLVVAHEGIQDDGEREGFAFGDLRGEHAVAVVTPPELNGLKLFVAFAFAGDAGAPAVEAALALFANETMVGIGHDFLVPQRYVLDKGASRIVQLMGEECLPDSACGAPHGWCRGFGGLGVVWCGIRGVGRQDET